MSCIKEGQLYSINQYGFYQRSDSNFDSPLPCPPGLYVQPLNRPDLFISEDKFIKCSGEEGLPQEIKSYQRLGPHPNLLRYYGYRLTPAGHCIILEYLPDIIPFRDLVGTQPPQFHELVQQSLAVLKYIHSQGVSHGDLHSENLVWDVDRQRVVLIDFDRSEPLRSRRTAREELGDMALILWTLIDESVPGLVQWEADTGNFKPLVKYIMEQRSKYTSMIEDIDLILENLLSYPARR